MVATALMQYGRGQVPAKRVYIRTATVQLQARLRTLCRSLRDGQLEQREFLRGVGHTVRLCKINGNIMYST